ncbi:NADPH dehydrogenase NamA [Serratia marcescens]|uniref:NADPH dehydrogenase NamA n=1 Tax=Serratia marcescens TaxID=615 RepID=UPI00277402FD|nr:NADPH dehydrogenase NamA [Serratia marcescens]MDP8601054.1 NADPH dehydrogenase NamA [Serratia marcescens]MDP8685754.1 NADPH dehydrogenase NamA [Serratia marcescens]MDP8735336.1 NADPH dehydrogenase NamA [Serratia marcescens]MDP8794652.1 NADPH dehydrogenase NamA [Serratia marcescens]HEJ7835081.1 NADPH dehydrogenase NamA [Serratia marcescens]
MSSLLLSEYCIKNLKLKNRVVMSPMCMHSAGDDGFVTDFHRIHYPARALGQAGLIFLETLAVEKDGRVGPGDLGIWSDEHISGLRSLVAQLHEHGAAAAAQIGHSGRMADFSDVRTVAPSAIAFSEQSRIPAELTKEEIQHIVRHFGDAARRAAEAGFDVLEVHTAHGYLLNEFLSPLSNHRTDEYGGTPENRYRIVSEVIESVKENWKGPLFVRISSTDYAEGGNTPESFLYYGKRMKDQGVDLVDCSSGGIAPVKVSSYPNYQVPAAELLRKELQIPVSAVGLIDSGKQAEEILRNGRADLVFIGRAMLRDPFWVRTAADQLRQKIASPVQYTRYGAVWQDVQQ